MSKRKRAKRSLSGPGPAKLKIFAGGLTNAAQQHIENVLASESLNILHPSSLRSVAISIIGRSDVIFILHL